MVWMHEALWKEQHEFNMRVRDIHVRKRVSSRPMSLLDICSESNLQQMNSMWPRNVGKLRLKNRWHTSKSTLYFYKLEMIASLTAAT
jgi:hypothetical protein